MDKTGPDPHGLGQNRPDSGLREGTRGKAARFPGRRLAFLTILVRGCGSGAVLSRGAQPPPNRRLQGPRQRRFGGKDARRKSSAAALARDQRRAARRRQRARTRHPPALPGRSSSAQAPPGGRARLNHPPPFIRSRLKPQTTFDDDCVKDGALPWRLWQDGALHSHMRGHTTAHCAPESRTAHARAIRRHHGLSFEVRRQDGRHV